MPHNVLSGFSAAGILGVPSVAVVFARREVLVMVMRKHQRYFPSATGGRAAARLRHRRQRPRRRADRARRCARDHKGLGVRDQHSQGILSPEHLAAREGYAVCPNGCMAVWC